MPIPTRRTTHERPGFIWIPQEGTANYKVEVIRGDDTVDDITDLAFPLMIEDGVTDAIGRFEFDIWDLNETYVNAWTGNEVFKYYCEYGSGTPTELRFRGRVEKVSKMGNKLRVKGRSESLKFLDITVTKKFEETDCSEILKELISTYGSGFTDTNVETSGKIVSKEWFQTPYWNCVQELTEAAVFDCYVDKDLDFHFFEVGSRTNKNEAIVHQQNLVEVKDFADDISLLKNRVIVYGVEKDGIKEIYTAEDTISQNLYGIKEKIIHDSTITNQTQAMDLAGATLSKNKDPQVVGEVKGILLATIQPGEKIRLSSPQDGIDPGTYDIISYKHNISQSEYFTTVRVSKEPRKVQHILKSIIKESDQERDSSTNPEEMRYTYNFLFNEDSGVHFNTEIVDGVLRLKSGQSSGNWESDTRTTLTNVTDAYNLGLGVNLSGASFQVSGDSGSNYEDIENLTKIGLITSSGTFLKVKVTLTDTTTELDSLSVQYNLT